jgi:anti-anti-sigma regulatory factor
MTVVYHELLPESYLLILAPGRTEEPEAALAHSLHCAQRSGKAAVWIDCGMLHSLSDEAARLLWGAHHQLEAKHAKLVLVHVPDRVRRDLLKRELGPAPCIVPTLLDAARQTTQGYEDALA